MRSGNIAAHLIAVLLVFCGLALGQTITSIAGGGPNNLPAIQSNLVAPTAVAFDGAGNMYVADLARVYKVDTSGKLTVFAGDGFGTGCGNGDGGPATAAELDDPDGLAVDAQGDVFIADTCSGYGSVVREVTPDGKITTYAGNSTQAGLLGDGGPAIDSRLSRPQALAVDAAGDLFIADAGNNRVREVTANTGIITTVAGGAVGSSPATKLALTGIGGIAVDASGNLFIVENAVPNGTTTASGVIYRVALSSGAVTTVAGDGAQAAGNAVVATQAALPIINCIAVDAVDNIYLATASPRSGDSGDAVYEVLAAGGALQLFAGGGTNPLPGALGASATSADLAVNENDSAVVSALALAPKGELALVVGEDNGLGNVLGVADDDTLSNLAGNFTSFYSGDGAPATDASLTGSKIAIDSAGDVFIAADHRIREWAASTGELTTVAGTGQYDYSKGSTGDGGPAAKATMYADAVAVDAKGNLYIADFCTVREVAAVNGTISTIVGNGGLCQDTGDGGPAIQADLSPITALLVDASGNLFISDSNAVREVAAATGMITTVVTPNALRAQPQGLAVDAHGDLFVATGNAVEEITPGANMPQTVAGGSGYSGRPTLASDGGPASGAVLQNADSIAVDSAGNLYIADAGDYAIRRVDATTGIIETIAGTGVQGYTGDGRPAQSAELSDPVDLALDSAGNLYVLDGSYNGLFVADYGAQYGIRHIRKITSAAAPLTPVLSPTSLTFTADVGTTSAPQTVTLFNPTGLNEFPYIAVPANFAESDNCYGYLTAGASCTIAVTFSPIAAGFANGQLSISTNAGSDLTVALSGHGAAPTTPGFVASGLDFGSQITGTASNTQTINFANSGSAAITINSITVPAGYTETNTCGTSLAAGASCTITVTFKPSAAGAASGVVTINTSAGVFTASLTGSGIAAPVDSADQANQIIKTIAGGGPNNLPANASGLYQPRAITYDAAGNLYIADSSHRVFKVAPDGTMTVFAGDFVNGYTGDGGPATNAELEEPSGLAVDSEGDVFIADQFARAVREVTPDGTIHTYAGGPNCVQGGNAANACLNEPTDLALDAAGDLLIAEFGDVREVNAATGASTIVASANPNGGGVPLPSGTDVFYSLASDGGGNLYIGAEDIGVFRLNLKSGALSQIFIPPTATGPYVANLYTKLATDASGNVYFAVSLTPTTTVVYQIPANGDAPTVIAGSGESLLPGAAKGPATASQFYLISGLAVDPSGKLSILSRSQTSLAGYVSQIASDGTLQIVAGDGNEFYAGDGAAPTDAGMQAVGMAMDAAGNIYFADLDDYRIRELVAATGKITTIAGTGQYDFTAGSTGDGGSATKATLDPYALTVDSAGNVYFGDGCSVREITASTGTVTTIAGVAGAVTCGFAGDGGKATQAKLGFVSGLLADPQGDIYISDFDHGLVRKIAASTGIITTIAGGGNGLGSNVGDGGPATKATLFSPYGLALDAAGNLYIADNGTGATNIPDGRIREVNAKTGVISTVAGGGGGANSGDNGAAVDATMYPIGVAVDPAGNLFITDSNDEVRRTDATTGVIQAVAGNGTNGFSGDGGPAAQALVFNPGFLLLDATGNLIFADNYFRLRQITHATGLPYVNPSSLSFGVQLDGKTSAAQTLTLTNTAPSSLAVTIAASGDFAQTNTCNGSVASDATCTISVTFNPAATGSRTGSVAVTDSAGSSPQMVALSGTGTDVTATLSSASLDFGNQNLTTTSSAQTVTLTNSGTAALTVSSIAASGDFAETNTCGTSVAAGASCTISVTFAPKTAAAEKGTLTVTDNAPDSPQTAALTGTGVGFTLTPPTTTSATVTAGSPATFTVSLNPGNFTGSVALSCTGAPAQSTCTVSPTSASLTAGGAAQPVTVTLTTTASSIAPPLPASPQGGPAWPLSPWQLGLLGLAALLALALEVSLRGSPRRRARRRHGWALGVVLAAALAAAACGGGATAPPPPPPPAKTPGTPTGTYTLSVIAKSSAMTQTITLTVTVQ